MAENAVLFFTYGSVKRMLGEKPGEEELSLLQLACAGGVAGAIASFVLNPFEVIKGRWNICNADYLFFSDYLCNMTFIWYIIGIFVCSYYAWIDKYDEWYDT